MKRILIAACLIGMTTSVLAADVGVSITVGEPGFYGRIDIGNVSQPRLIYERPMVIIAPAPNVRLQPLYLHVPPGHAKKWKKHCHEYNACGQPVYFVQNNWYSDVYVPQYRERKGKKHDGDYPGQGYGNDKKDKKDKKDKDRD